MKPWGHAVHAFPRIMAASERHGRKKGDAPPIKVWSTETSASGFIPAGEASPVGENPSMNLNQRFIKKTYHGKGGDKPCGIVARREEWHTTDKKSV